METVRTRRMWVEKEEKQSIREKVHITIPMQKISKYRDEVGELGCCLSSVEKGIKIPLFDNISLD